jgi:hypothetical protein
MKRDQPDWILDQALASLWRSWMNRWWWLTLGLWLTLAPASLWQLRHTGQQLAQYFTWAALRYGLAFNRGAAAGLGLCLGLTVALLLSETRHLYWGLSRRERYRLMRALRRQTLSAQRQSVRK